MALTEKLSLVEQGLNTKAELLEWIEETRNWDNPPILTSEEVRYLESVLRPGGGHKQMYGVELEDGINRIKISITPDMYRVATDSRIATEAARYLHNDILKQYLFNPNVDGKYVGIEGCSGSGSQTWALANEGLWVRDAVEKNMKTSKLAVRNLELLGMRKLMLTIHTADIIDVLQTEIWAQNGSLEKLVHWIMLDPDWHGKPYKTNEPFKFRDMSPDGNELISLALRVAPVVGIKAPTSMSTEEIAGLAADNNVNAYIRNIALPISSQELLTERMVFFVDPSSLIGSKSDRIVEETTIRLS